jgi:cell wall-associated NlpC family hydrolase
LVTPSPGDFGVVHMGGDAGKLIRFAQYLNGDGFADYEHAFVYVGNGQIVEAEPGGAKLVSIHYDNVLWSTGWYDLTDPQRVLICGAAKRYVGTPYSAADYYALVAKRLNMGPLIPGLRDYVASSGHMICSQLVDRCYQDGGKQLFKDGRWNGYVTPGALAGLIGGWS